MTMFPGAVPVYPGFTGSHTLSVDNHASQHNSEQGDISAIATKIGTGSSTPVNQRLLRGNGTGTSVWAQADLTTDVTGVLPQANGGTGGNAAILAVIYPIGCIYTEITGISPSATFGFGTWVSFGTGQTLVGVDPGQTEFNTVQKTGGEKTHTLTTAELASHTHAPTDPGHTHTINVSGVAGIAIPVANGGATGATNPTSSSTTGITIGNAGSDNAHNNLQPYVTVYFWRRTA